MEKFHLQAKELLARWQALSLPRKLALTSGFLVVCIVVGLLWWAAQPDYRVLYAGLSAEEAGAITGKLQAKGVSFKLSSNGTTILVPADQAMQVHLDLTSEGIPGSSKIGKGFDLFDQPMLSATPFNQHVNFVRAQQNELARTIMQVDPIVFARVHLVRPEPSPFIRDQKPTTASVMLKLRPGASLNRNTVAGIAALVAGSVEGLTKENIRIMDASGRLLSDERDPDTGLIGSLIDQRKDVETHLAREAERVLAHVLGQGKSIVRVTAELNTKLEKGREELINLDRKATKTEKSTLNKTQSSAATKGGAPGATSNLSKSSSPGGGIGSNSTQETQQVDYDYPRTFVEWQKKHGAIERLTIAAFVDVSALTKSEQPISMADIQEIVKKAVGFKAERDEIQVTQVKMPVVSAETFEEEVSTQLRWQTVLTVVRNVSIAMVALCVCPIVWMVVRRLTKTVPMPEQQAPKLQRLTEDMERNPEALAKILSAWIDRSESSERKAA